jgi:tRNA A37 threonylcarbamoyladenosine biosynthesis protein TsaE
MMRALKLKNSDIKQVKTDSITFKSVNDDYRNYIHNNLSGWKTEEYKQITKPNIMKREPLSFKYKSYEGTEYKQIEKSGTLALGNAGCGKTYDIINNIIPKLNDDYMILSPSHATIKEYKQLELNCDVIQTYIYSNKIPEANNIIVDEIGMVNISGWNMLVKCKIAGKNIMVYGDNTQLEPVNSVICDNQNFYNLMFDTQLPYNTKIIEIILVLNTMMN